MPADGVFEKEEDGGDGDGADGEVDVEAPAPGDAWSSKECISNKTKVLEAG